MPSELYEIAKVVGSAIVGAGLTIAVIAKFGESLFFKHLDHKYAESLALKNSQLQQDLETTKNELNRSLQQDVARYKSDLEVLSGQRARLLERKIDSILELNKYYVLVVNALSTFINMNHNYIDEIAYTFNFQKKEGAKFSNDGLHVEFKRKHWEKIREPVKSAVENYSNYLALKMPILPAEFASSELSVAEELRDCIEASEKLFYRSAGLSYEIVEPEEGLMPEECLEEIEEHVKLSQARKKQIEKYEKNLLSKAKASNELIESLLG